MGSTVLEPVPTGSIDRFGLSTATTTRNGLARVGTVYDPARFAAAIPVHFHPLGGTKFLGLFDGYWKDATVSTTTPGRHTAKTAVDAPAAAVIDAATGQLSVPTGVPSFTLPVSGALALTSAASSTNFVMTLSTGSGKALLHHWSISRDGSLLLMGEYSIPDIQTDSQTVRFDRGVYFDQPWIYLWGVGLADNRIYTARQYVSKLNRPWLYQTDHGWSPTGATPVLAATTVGPMSTVLWRGTTLVSTVATVGSDKVGQIWSTRTMTDPWILRHEAVIAPTTSWLGAGLMLQPQVIANPAAVADSAIGSIPWVSTAYVGTAGNEALGVSWGLFPVPQSMA